MSGDSSRAARSVIWSAVENGGLAAVSFGSLIIYARFLTPSDFGLFSVVLAAVELFTILVTMPFHDALVQRQDVTERHFDTAFTGSLVLSVVLLAACASVAPLLAAILRNQASAPLLAVTALSFPLAALSSTIVARHRRELQFKALALRSLAGRLAGAAVGISLVVRGAGAWGLVAQQVTTAAVGTAVLWGATAHRPQLALRRAELRHLLGFGGYAVTTLVAGFAIGRVFTIAAGLLLGTGAAGVLNLAFRVVDVFWAIAASAINQVALPVFAPRRFDPEVLGRAYRTAVTFSSLLLYPCFIGLAVVAPEIVQLLFGARWLGVAPYIAALSLTVVFRVPRQLMRAALSAAGRPQDALPGYGVEVVVLALGLGASLVTGGATAPTVMALWIAREVAATPALSGALRRAGGVSYRQQLLGGLGALAASLPMAAAVIVVRGLLPAGWSALARLAVLVPCGVGAFGAAAWVIDQAALMRVFGFLGSAWRRSSASPLAKDAVAP
jgi:O-antigen/teichoic acid export membrane protein